MRLPIFLLAFLFPAADTPPATMTKIVVRLIGPDIKPGSHAALPKTIYRAGNHFARIEDAPSSRMQSQKLIIIAEPDAYSVNLTDKKGTHAIDQGGPDDLHLPMVLPLDPNRQLGKLDGLEFGSELQFFENAGASRRPGPLINSKTTDAYDLQTPAGIATLVTESNSGVPKSVSWQTKDGTYKYEYFQYREEPFQPRLFSKPPGISYQEIRPARLSEQG
jgi:hypothetical protein